VWRSPNPLFPSVVRTYQESFSQLYAFDVRETANRVLVGLADAEPRSRGTLKARAARLTRGRGVPFSLLPLLARRSRGPGAGYTTHPEASVLRDSGG
jgi:spermidine synthase